MWLDLLGSAVAGYRGVLIQVTGIRLGAKQTVAGFAPFVRVENGVALSDLGKDWRQLDEILSPSGADQFPLRYFFGSPEDSRTRTL